MGPIEPGAGNAADPTLNRLILHVPLIESLPGGAVRLPQPLYRALARARRVACDADQALASLFGSAPLPAPAVSSALAEPRTRRDATGGHWLRFDPIRLLPDLTAVWVDRPLPLDFASAELQPVVAELRTMFEHDGLEWRPSGGGFGLLSLEKSPDCEFLPPDAAHGMRLDEVLPTGPDASRWRKLINESQMVFHQFRAMGRADQQGVGLWFWGAGGNSAPPDVSEPICVVDRADSAIVTGLAEWLGAERLDPGTRFDDARTACAYVHWPLQGADVQAALAQLVDAWLAPALHALRRGRLAEIAIVGSSGCWRMGRLDALAFWRRSVDGFAPSGGED